MKWKNQTRYVGQFTHSVLPYGFTLLQSGRRHIDWVGVGYEGHEDLTMEVHPMDDGTYLTTAGAGEPEERCASLAEAVAAACDYYVPGFADDDVALTKVVSAIEKESGV